MKEMFDDLVDEIQVSTTKAIKVYVWAEVNDTSKDKVAKLAEVKRYCVEWLGEEGFNEIYEQLKREASC